MCPSHACTVQHAQRYRHCGVGTKDSEDDGETSDGKKEYVFYNYMKLLYCLKLFSAQ